MVSCFFLFFTVLFTTGRKWSMSWMQTEILNSIWKTEKAPVLFLIKSAHIHVLPFVLYVLKLDRSCADRKRLHDPGAEADLGCRNAHDSSGRRVNCRYTLPSHVCVCFVVQEKRNKEGKKTLEPRAIKTFYTWGVQTAWFQNAIYCRARDCRRVTTTKWWKRGHNIWYQTYHLTSVYSHSQWDLIVNKKNWTQTDSHDVSSAASATAFKPCSPQ